MIVQVTEHFRRALALAALVGLAVLPEAAQAQTPASPENESPPAADSSPGDSAVFPTLEVLADGMAFWRRVFLEHPSSHVLIHDREHMRVIWRTVELPADLVPGARRDIVKQEMDDVRLRLLHLERGGAVRDPADAALVAAAGGRDAPIFAGAAERLRGQSGIAESFRAGLLRALAWLPQMQEILRSEGVPVELAALPFVESSFNPLARSSAGAAGLWQLMPATARSLGLRVGGSLDERFDVLKATRAAARMLRQNHRMLGSWPLAVTAYNHGPNGVRRAVVQVGSADLAYLIDNYQRSTWGFSSKNFYAEFLTVLDILRSGAADAALAQVEADAVSGAAIVVQAEAPGGDPADAGDTSLR